MELPVIDKLFWNYLFTRCNHAGIWDVNFKLAEMLIGEKLDFDHIKETFKGRYISIYRDKKWFISEFIFFQYGELNENCNPHKSVTSTLKKLTLYEPFIKGTLRDKDKDKDKDKMIDMDY